MGNKWMDTGRRRVKIRHVGTWRPWFTLQKIGTFLNNSVEPLTILERRK